MCLESSKDTWTLVSLCVLLKHIYENKYLISLWWCGSGRSLCRDWSTARLLVLWICQVYSWHCSSAGACEGFHGVEERYVLTSLTKNVLSFAEFFLTVTWKSEDRPSLWLITLRVIYCNCNCHPCPVGVECTPVWQESEGSSAFRTKIKLSFALRFECTGESPV